MSKIRQQLDDNQQTYKIHRVCENIVTLDTGIIKYTCSEYKKLLDAEKSIDDLTNDLKIRIKRMNYDAVAKCMVHCSEINIIQDALNHSGVKSFGELV